MAWAWIPTGPSPVAGPQASTFTSLSLSFPACTRADQRGLWGTFLSEATETGCHAVLGSTSRRRGRWSGGLAVGTSSELWSI